MTAAHLHLINKCRSRNCYKVLIVCIMLYDLAIGFLGTSVTHEKNSPLTDILDLYPQHNVTIDV